jgi:hypothetical protein
MGRFADESLVRRRTRLMPDRNSVYGDMIMHLKSEIATDHPVTDAPSADFVRAVSDFLDTDPADLLTELGYYRRNDATVPTPKTEPISVHADAVTAAR